MEPSSDDLVWTQSSVMDYRMIPPCSKLFKVLRGCFVAMHWRYIVDDLTLTGHFSFSLGLWPLCNSSRPFAVGFPAICLLAASAPRKFSFCIVRALGVFHILAVCSCNTAIAWLFSGRYHRPTFLCPLRMIIPSK